MTGGWGFKSLFTVSDTPVLFSSPFQVRLDAASRGPHGVLCPEWVPSPDATTAKGEAIIPPNLRNRIKDNATFVYAPLRDSAKELLRAVDMERFDGLSLAFLRHLQKLELMLVSSTGEGAAETKVIKTLTYSAAVTQVKVEGGGAAAKTLQDAVHLQAHKALDCTLRLNTSVKVRETTQEEAPDRFYRIHKFTVGLDESATTEMALAFPLDADRKPLLKEKDKDANTEHVFSYVPVPNAGKLPFAFHADFDLTSDMQGLMPTSSWNQWVLACAARLFVISFLTDSKLRKCRVSSAQEARTWVTECLPIRQETTWTTTSRPSGRSGRGCGGVWGRPSPSCCRRTCSSRRRAA
jgi:hypothetical protein